MADDQREAIRALCAGDEKELFYSILSRIGDKWSLLVMGNLGKKAGRYTELLDATPGISRRMLTVTLRQLERDGLIERVVHTDVPPWVEYTLTDLGRTLREPALAVATWALEHKDVIVNSRAAYDASTSHLSEVAS